jgi:hypothetical protein
VLLAFADAGPWWDGEINAELLEAALGYSRARGPARLLLAAMAALASVDGVVEDLTTEQLSAAAGLVDRTYRRARQTLLASGEVILLSGLGGRGNTNRWQIPDPRELVGKMPRPAARRVAPPPGARPLVATVAASDGHETADHAVALLSQREHARAGGKGGQDRTVSAQKCPVVTGVSGVKGGQDRTVSPQKCPVVTGVSGVKGGQGRTVSAQTPAETPAKTPAPNARAGREPQNPRTREHPPTPLAGGLGTDSVLVEETYLTDRGRTRRRLVTVDLAQVRRGLTSPSAGDRGDWDRVRALLLEAAGESVFLLWLDQLELIAIDRSGKLVLTGQPDQLSWVRDRFWRLISGCGERIGRELRIAEQQEAIAMGGATGAALSDVCVGSTNNRRVS